MSKINLTFYAKRREGDTTSSSKVVPIHCEIVYQVNGYWKRLRFSTGEKCAIKHFKNQRVYHTVSYATQINGRLAVIQSNAESIYRDAIEKGTMPHRDKFREMILGKSYAVKEERDLMTDYNAFIEYHESKGTSKGSLSHLLILRTHLEQFAKRHRYALTYDNINLSFYGKFLHYLQNYEHRKDMTYEENTVGNFIKKLKMFLNWAKGNGWNPYDFYLHPEFKISEKRVDNVYLEQSELDTLANLDLSNRPFLNNTRAWFLIACETGMRYSDYPQLRKGNIKEVTEGYDYTYQPRKTSRSSKVKVTVPLSITAVKVLLRFGFEMPAPASNQKMNKGLKELMRLAGVDKAIGTHTARRTFATLRYKDNLYPVQAIMKITGHRTEKEFYKYLCIDGQENANLFRLHDDRYKIAASGLLETKLKVV